MAAMLHNWNKENVKCITKNIFVSFKKELIAVQLGYHARSLSQL